MSVSLVVAVSANNIIGRGGALPWRLAQDLQHFKRLTMGKPIVMGRLTFESIGRALPGRQNIVISSRADYSAAGCDIVSSPAAAIHAAGAADEVMVIGGGTIYRQFLPLAERIYMTRVLATVTGDACFPALDESEWQESGYDEHRADASNEFDYAFLTLQRVR